MGARMWDEVWLPLLISLATQIGVTALGFLSVRLWKCFFKQLTPQTAVEESPHDQPFPDGDAAAHADGVPDLELGNGYGPAEGQQSMAEPELEPGIVNGGEAPKATVTGDAARGVLVPVETDVPHSQQEETVVE